MLGKMQVLGTNLKCTKQPNGKFLYEYSIEVHPEEEDEDLASILRPNVASTAAKSTSGSTYGTSSYETRTGDQAQAQSTTIAEFLSHVTVRSVIEYFRTETSCDHHGVFVPRLAYAIGHGYDKTYPLTNDDLDKSLADLMVDRNEANTLSIIADIC
ncbi:hypothetical protein NECAME_16981 [Necator americanus]|uniref:Uncharacterized protein n=1 Tax=Necator americanus TaxID=51031 RepID=W2TV04_NECAM|nr:hypothetical protein NECAME_16981 [Necator americanus]ETN84867.1 hypothetical protein NECAME_16981 [Necator americanus]